MMVVFNIILNRVLEHIIMIKLKPIIRVIGVKMSNMGLECLIRSKNTMKESGIRVFGMAVVIIKIKSRIKYISDNSKKGTDQGKEGLFIVMGLFILVS